MKRKTLREKFEESYTAVPVPADNAQGFKMKYIYYAPWYRWDLPSEKMRMMKSMMLFASIVGFLLCLFCMSRRAEINVMPIVYIPCTLMLCCHIMEFSGLFQFLAAGARTTKMNYDEISRILKTFPLIRAALGCIPVVCCVYFAIKEERTLFYVAMALAYILISVSSWGIEYYYNRIPVVVDKNNTLAEYDKIEEQLETK